MITREIREHGNVFHAFTDLLNVHISLRMLGWQGRRRQVRGVAQRPSVAARGALQGCCRPQTAAGLAEAVLLAPANKQCRNNNIGPSSFCFYALRFCCSTITRLDHWTPYGRLWRRVAGCRPCQMACRHRLQVCRHLMPDLMMTTPLVVPQYARAGRQPHWRPGVKLLGSDCMQMVPSTSSG